MIMAASGSHYPLKWFVKRDKYVSEEISKSALIILNYKLRGLEHVIKAYWDYFSVIACADGGSNILFDMIDQDTGRYVPKYICGDMDSARKEVLEFYESKGCSIKPSDDQDSTDFTKTLEHLISLKKVGQLQFSSVYVINGIGGRLDQTLANINTLFSDNGVSIYLMSEDSLCFVLEPGRHIINVDSEFEEGHCGLVPLGESCLSCTTSGLMWNLADDTMDVGGLISTNNLIVGKEIVVSNSNKLLWTMSHTLVNHYSHEM